MNELRKLLLLVVPALILALAGCGGGGGNASITTTTPNDILAAAGATGQMTVTVASTAGKQVAGLKVTYTNDHPEALQLNSTSQTVGSDGTATVTYVARSVSVDTLCTITAKVDTITSVQTVLVKGTGAAVPPPVSATPNAIVFINASPENIALRNTVGSGRSVTSVVTFEVRDTANNKLSGQTVDFSLNTTIGGIDITPKSAISDSNGRVQTIVSSGDVATPVRVTATIRGTTKSIQSDELTISTGISTQDRFSLSLDTHNPNAWQTDGTQVSVGVALADHFGNPVPNGTAVSFITSFGSIQPSCFTTGGRCSVTWTSQGIRPTGGKFAILAYTVGEEPFIDSNLNGVADSGPCVPLFWGGVGNIQKCGEFYDIPEAFLDKNWNGIRDLDEEALDFNRDQIYNDILNTPPVYNGILRPSSVVGATSIYNYMNAYLVASSAEASISLTPLTVPFVSVVPATLTVVDVNANPLPKGTTIALTVVPGTTTPCVSLSNSQFTVGDANAPGANTTIFDLNMTNICLSSSGARDSVKVTVTVPSVQPQTRTFTLVY